MMRIAQSLLIFVLSVAPAAALDDAFDAQVVSATVVRDGFGDWQPQIGTLAVGDSVDVIDCSVDACMIAWSGALERAAWVPSNALSVDGASVTEVARQQQLERMRSPVITGLEIRTEGDSYMSGAYGFVLNTYLAELMARPVVNTAMGGSDLPSALTRIAAAKNKALAGNLTVIWDGSDNGLTSIDSYVDGYARIIETLGHDRFVIIPPAYGTDLQVVAEVLQQRWPDNVLDWRPTLADASGAIALAQYARPGEDDAHLGEGALRAMAASIKTFILARGW